MGTGKRKKQNATVKANGGSGGRGGAGNKHKGTGAVDAPSVAASDARAEAENLAAAADAATASESGEDEEEEESDKEDQVSTKADKQGRRSNSGTPQGTPAKKNSAVDKVILRNEREEPAKEARHSDRADKLALEKKVRELEAQLAEKKTVNIGCIHIFYVTDLTTLSGEHSSFQSEEAQIHGLCGQV
jgi:hypothetical protein